MQRKKGKAKVYNSNQSSFIVTRNSLKAKENHKNRNTVARGSFIGGEGAPQDSSLGDS